MTDPEIEKLEQAASDAYKRGGWTSWRDPEPTAILALIARLRAAEDRIKAKDLYRCQGCGALIGKESTFAKVSDIEAKAKAAEAKSAELAGRVEQATLALNEIKTIRHSYKMSDQFCGCGCLELAQDIADVFLSPAKAGQ